MLDDILDLAGSILLDISDLESFKPRTRRILEVLSLILGLTAMVLYFRS